MIYIGFIKCFNNLSAKKLFTAVHGSHAWLHPKIEGAEPRPGGRGWAGAVQDGQTLDEAERGGGGRH